MPSSSPGDHFGTWSVGEELRFLCLLGTLQTLPRPFTIQPPPASWVAAPPSCALISPNLCLDPSCSVTSPCLCIHSHLRPGEGAKLFLPEDLTQVSPVLQLPPGHRRTPQALVKMSGRCSENTFAALSRARPGPQHLSRQNVLCADITSDGPPIGSGTKGTCPLGWQLEAPASGQRKGSLSHT